VDAADLDDEARLLLDAAFLRAEPLVFDDAAFDDVRPTVDLVFADDDLAAEEVDLLPAVDEPRLAVGLLPERDALDFADVDERSAGRDAALFVLDALFARDDDVDLDAAVFDAPARDEDADLPADEPAPRDVPLFAPTLRDELLFVALFFDAAETGFAFFDALDLEEFDDLLPAFFDDGVLVGILFPQLDQI
jgi:hypothetical protein